MTINRLPDLAYQILELLTTSDLLTQEEIQEALDVDKKSVKYAIRRLQENEIVQQVPHLLDMRSVNYRLPDPDEFEQIASNVSKEVFQKINNTIKDPLYNLESDRLSQDIKY